MRYRSDSSITGSVGLTNNLLEQIILPGTRNNSYIAGTHWITKGFIKYVYVVHHSNWKLRDKTLNLILSHSNENCVFCNMLLYHIKRKLGLKNAFVSYSLIILG